MVFENLQVMHKKFGVGTVVSKQDRYMKVKFADCEKEFVYPDVFAKFLTLADGTVNDEINADLNASNTKKAEIKAKKEQELLHSMTHGIVIPGKETLTDPDEEERANKNNTENEEI